MFSSERFRQVFDRYPADSVAKCENCQGTEQPARGEDHSNELCPCCFQGKVLKFAVGSITHDHYYALMMTKPLNDLSTDQFKKSLRVLTLFAADLRAVTTDPETGQINRIHVMFKPSSENLRADIRELLGFNDDRIFDKTDPGLLHVTPDQLESLLKSCEPNQGVYGFCR